MVFKKLSLVSLIILLLGFKAKALADLVVTATTFSPTTISKGAYITVNATVANIGNIPSQANFMFIYFTPDLNVEASEIISRVSIKGLTPGETQNISFVYPIPLTLNAGKYYIGLELDPFKIVNENNEQNIYCVSNSGQCAQFTISNTTVARRKLPYPIIFTHGWTGDSRTWDSFTNEANRYYGWTFGGRLDFCLNPDGTQLNSDNYILNLTKASNITVGDYYYVNFDIATDGELFVGNDGIPFNDDYSNQSAVVKQGWAVREAIKLVLEKTGAEKVILVGHSMGGLASRQYIQNPINWQASGHQVAKLLTIGTPNGGSNASGAALGSFFGYDELSEAVRDLRYPSAFVPGLFLFGGIENSLSLYYNDDVNCNGFVGDNITGLNQKVSPSNIAYSCIVSDYTGLGSDGVVFTNRADINNYLLSQPPLSVIYADKFETTTNHLNIHKENHSTLIQGLDEPYLYDLAYPIKLNTPSMGFITKQANNNPLPPPSNQIDFDDYEFTLEESGTVQLRIWNIPVNDFAGFILNEQYDVIYELQSEGKSNLELDINLTSGKYFFEIGGIPTENSWRFPYLFQLGFTPFSGLTADFNAITAQGCAPLVVQFNNQATGNPTNFTWTFPGGTPSTSTAPSPTVIYSTPGTYPVSLTVRNTQGISRSVTKSGFITVGTKPKANFTYSALGNNLVQFLNTSENEGLNATYLWSFGDGKTSIEASPLHQYANSGSFTARLTVQNNCGNETKEIVVSNLTTRVSSFDISNSIEIFPNPNTGEFIIKISNQENTKFNLNFYDQSGKLVFSKTLQKQSSKLEESLNLENLPSGQYIVEVIGEFQKGSKKIVIFR